MPKVELTIKTNPGAGPATIQKGPATDYSMLLEMKRRSLMIMPQLLKTPVGDQNQKPFIREGHLQAGSGTEGTAAVEYYKVKGIQLNRYKF